ncbi:addiction module antidote protein [Endozoicomonas euniceicola]|uniref:Addiction module antidote protein n=1 Tax=Endozoicomonas euniceicola TaxID=1234143 RepID=A0ABY6GRB5_9GAMM|nr:addiction module antidote protein [Endozoicomonas euniceicola]UYM15297.1 putative addiction module antidote protein [Endozoicomonas euniceicola]
MNEKLTDFDPAEYLDDDESIQHYIDEAVATGHAGFIADSLGVVARAKGMTALAKATDLSRESLYRSLSGEGNPNLKTLLAVCSALGVTLHIGKPAQS